eukprot:14511231-Ditylum_brightwellii.AAC.1
MARMKKVACLINQSKQVTSNCQPMTELLELAKDIQTGVKGIFGCNPESNKGESKHRWHYRLNIIG